MSTRDPGQTFPGRDRGWMSPADAIHPIDLCSRVNIGEGYEYQRRGDRLPIGRVLREPERVERLNRWAIQLHGQEPTGYIWFYRSEAEIELWEAWREWVHHQPVEIHQSVRYQVRTPNDFLRVASIDHEHCNVYTEVYDYRGDLVESGWLLDGDDVASPMFDVLGDRARDWLADNGEWRLRLAGEEVDGSLIPDRDPPLPDGNSPRTE